MFRKALPLAVVALSLAVVTRADDAAPEKMKLDAPVRDFKLKDVMKDEESWVKLSELKGKTVVLFFVSDKCAVTWAYEKRTGKLIADFRKKGVVFVGIRSSDSDSAAEIRKYAEAKNFDIPVLFDDKNVIADYFGVVNTPQYGVIDKDGVLRYFGALDDNQTSEKFRDPEDTVKAHHVRDALDAVLAGKEVKVKSAKGYG
jgi:peroxiredoxin